jgi:predicted dinucleotide-binding enzyme
MEPNTAQSGHRPFTRRALILALAAAMPLAALLHSAPARSADQPIKIGIIGTGRIGSALAKLWVQAGHPVMISSRHPEQLQALAQSLGSLASVGTPQQAAAYGDAILLSVPYEALTDVAKEEGAALQGKLVLDPCNAIVPGNPTLMKQLQDRVAQNGGSGVAEQKLLKGALVVRAFNRMGSNQYPTLAHRSGELAAVPLTGDDQNAVKLAEQLVRDAGFDPVFVGPLSDTKRFDTRGALPFGPVTAAQARQALHLPAQ